MSENVEANTPVENQASHYGGAWLLPALLLSAGLAGYLGEQVIVANQSRFFTPEPGMPPWPDEYLAKQRWDNMRNHAIGFGGLGVMLLALIGLWIGLARSVPRAMVGLVIGGLLGMLAGIVTGAVGYIASARLLTSLMEGSFKAIIIFGPIWIVFCCVTTLFSALLAGVRAGVTRAFVIGLIAACAATFLYPLVSIIIFPIGRPELIVPEHTGVRYSAYLIGSLSAAVAAWLAVRPPRPQPSEAR